MDEQNRRLLKQGLELMYASLKEAIIHIEAISDPTTKVAVACLSGAVGALGTAVTALASEP